MFSHFIKNLLSRVTLEAYPAAVTNDGTPAAYYVQTDITHETKVLIYLEGGGYCVPK